MTCLPSCVLFPGQGGEKGQGELPLWAWAHYGHGHTVVFHSEGVGQATPARQLGTLLEAIGQAKRCTV